MKNSNLKSISLTCLFIVIFVTLSLAQWESLTPMPTPRGGTTAAVLDGKIYVMGGITAPNNAALQLVEIYNPVTDTWETGPEMPVRVMLAKSEVIDGKIYVIGGIGYDNGPGLDGILVFHPDEQQWTHHDGLLPNGMVMHASTVHDGKIYITGGGSGLSLAQNWTYVFDPATQNCEKLANMPSPRGLHASATIRDKIYVFGGAYLAQGVKPMYFYDPDTDTWQQDGEIFGKKVFLGSGVYGKYIYVFAGLTAVTNYDVSQGTWRYNTCSKTWEDMGHDYPELVVFIGYCDYIHENSDTYIYTFGGITEAYSNNSGEPMVSDKVFRYKTSTPTMITGGAVSGTWASDNSPYIIQDDIQVEKGSTLVIEPCVELLFKNKVRFDIFGQLIAEGNQESGIMFTAENPNETWNGLRIYDNNETGDSSKLVYCTIEHAFAKSDEEYGNNGGGLAIIRSDHVVVKHCKIRKNKTDGDSKTGGAGIAVGQCSPIITQNLIYQNIAKSEGHGGGIMLFQSESEVSNNIIRDNWAGGGGGISVIDYPIWSDKTPTIINNTIVDNFSEVHGGGICFALGQGNVVNNIIYFNESGDVGDQVNIGYNNNSQFHYNDIQGGKEAFSYIGLSEVAHFENNLEEDPMFIWYPHNLWLDGRYVDNHSPCIAAGTATIDINGNLIHAPEKDFKDDPRVNSPNGNIDMGAFEYPWLVNIKEARLHSFDLAVSPNPASENVQFSFKLKASANVLIEVYDMAGKKRAVVLDTKLLQGPHEINWNTNLIGQGFYLISLKINNDFITTKLIVTKEKID